LHYGAVGVGSLLHLQLLLLQNNFGLSRNNYKERACWAFGKRLWRSLWPDNALWGILAKQTPLIEK
jgi:hypothetical protein